MSFNTREKKQFFWFISAVFVYRTTSDGITFKIQQGWVSFHTTDQKREDIFKQNCVTIGGSVVCHAKQ